LVLFYIINHHVYLISSVCLCAINQDISETSFAKFIADSSYILLWKWLTFGADHIQDGWLSIIFVLITLWALPLLASSHCATATIQLLVDHGGW